MRSPRTGKVNRGGIAKITRALGRGWTPALGIGPGRYLRKSRRARKGGEA